jgi:hypothetical protein
MAGRQFALYFSWNRTAELGADLGQLDNRYPALFEFRRMLWPEFERLADPGKFAQGIEGFMDDVILSDFQFFRRHIEDETGNLVSVAQRRAGDIETPLGLVCSGGNDTLIVVSLDHQRTGQTASAEEIDAAREFLADSRHTLIVCPHHDIGDVTGLPADQWLSAQEVEFRHHGDLTIPPQQRFSSFARSLLEGLGAPLENRYGLSPAKLTSGDPAPLEIDAGADRFALLAGVSTFNLHPRLPHFAPPAGRPTKYDVLARQTINMAVPSHPFTETGRGDFDALLQARPEVCAGRLLVCDATMWSSAFGGLQSLQRFWTNLARLSRQ